MNPKPEPVIHPGCGGTGRWIGQDRILGGIYECERCHQGFTDHSRTINVTPEPAKELPAGGETK